MCFGGLRRALAGLGFGSARLRDRRGRGRSPSHRRVAAVGAHAHAGAERARARDEARAAKDWAAADAIRDELTGAGWLVEDTADGTQVRPA